MPNARGRHHRKLSCAATILDTILSRLPGRIETWRAYPPTWTGNGDDYVGKHRR